MVDFSLVSFGHSTVAALVSFFFGRVSIVLTITEDPNNDRRLSTFDGSMTGSSLVDPVCICTRLSEVLAVSRDVCCCNCTLR